MVQNIIGIVVSYVFVGLIMVAAKFFEKSGREATRKFIHIMLCNWWFIAMYFFENMWWAAFVPFTFVIINWISYKKDIIKVMERGEASDGLGTVYYAISLTVLALITFGIERPELGLVGILVMGYGDGLAAVIGQTVKSKEYTVLGHKKTVAGSAMMLFITFLIVAIYCISVPMDMWFIKAIVVSILVTFVEAVGIKGTDNLTVPLLTSCILYFMH